MWETDKMQGAMPRELRVALRSRWGISRPSSTDWLLARFPVYKIQVKEKRRWVTLAETFSMFETARILQDLDDKVYTSPEDQATTVDVRERQRAENRYVGQLNRAGRLGDGVAGPLHARRFDPLPQQEVFAAAAAYVGEADGPAQDPAF